MNKEKLRVLFIEDNLDDFTLLLRELNKGKYNIEYELVEDKKTFESALDKKWDVIISDYALPNFNGFEALKICNKKGLEIPFIIVSGTVGEDLAVEMMKAGAKDYIMKKSLKLLLPAIEREIEDAKIRQKNKLIALEREILFDIGKDLVTTENLDDLLEKIYINIKKILYAENCFIALYDSKKDEITFPFFKDKYDKKPAPMKKSKSLTDYVIRTGESILTNPELLKKLQKKNEIELIGTASESWLGVPLIIQSKVIGVLVIQSYDKNIHYSEYDKNFLEAIATDIAIAIERKRAEDALKKSEELYRVFINSTNDMAFLKDDEFKYILVNKANQKFLNKEIKEIIGKTDFDLMPKDIAANCRLSDEKALKSDGVVITEEMVEGRIYETHKFKVPLSKEKYGVGGYIRDISERKWVEENLNKSEEHYRTLLTAIPDLMFRFDKEGRFIDYHAEDTSMLYVPPEKFLGKKYSEILPPDIANLFEKTIEVIKTTNEIGKFEYKLLLPNGKEHFFEARVNFYQDEFITIIRDITEQKKAEFALKDSEERFRKIFEDSSFGIVLVDKNYRYIKVNSEFCKITGFSENELLLKPCIEITHPEYIEDNIDSLNKLLSGEINVCKKEKRYIRKDGVEHWCELTASVVRDDKGEFNYFLIMVEDINARKIAEEKIKESEEHFRNIVRNAEAGYFRINRDGLFEEVNNSWLHMHKYESDKEIIGKHFVSTQVDMDLDKANEIVKDLLKGKPIETGEFSRKCKDGSVGYHTFSISPVIENGEVTGIEGFLIDTTEKKKTLEALQASQERYKTLIETMNEGVILADNDDVIQLINRRCCDIFGYEPEELIGRIGYEYIVVEEDKKIIKDKNKLRLESIADSYEVRAFRKTGEKIWININGAPVKDNNGVVIGSVGIITDITERKLAEEELKKLSRAVEQSPVSIVITDTNGDIEYVNPKFVSLTGYLPEEVIGKNPRILKSGETPQTEYEKLWNTITSGNDWVGEFHNKKKNGDLYWESALISPIKSPDGKITHFLAIKEDITEKKQKEIELINAKEKAEESERLKSSFLANMSHELRTPMVGILGFAEILKDAVDNEELKDYSDNILKSGKRLLETLNLILDLSRIEAGKLEIKKGETDLVQLSKEVYINYVPEAEKKYLIIKFDSNYEHIISKVDERMLYESINNLVNNAIKFTKAGEIKIEVTADNNENKAYIKISDTGIGIPKESQKTIFEEFRQASEGYSRSFEGTGLGLTITKNFIEKNGGKITLDSEVGLGSVFTIELPLLKTYNESKKVEKIEVKEEKPTLEERKDIHLLCVDDDSFTREYLDYVLRDIYNISFAKDGYEAIEMTKAQKFSMILMDINLGKGIDGIETAKKIHKLPGCENIPIIAITAFAMKGDREEFLNSGMKNYISKPFKSNDLIEIIEEVLNKNK